MIKQLAIPLGREKTATKWQVMKHDANGSELTLPFCMDYSSSTPRKLRVAGKEDFLQHK